MQTKSQIFKFRRALILLSTFLLIFLASISLAADEISDELEEQKQKLQQILDEIGNVREQRTEQRALLEKLNQKMQCNWSLIQDYDACDKKYKEQKQEQLDCTQKAKEKAAKCLSEIDE